MPIDPILREAVAAMVDRIDRADEQIKVLEEMIGDYFKADSCRYGGEYNADTNEMLLTKDIVWPKPRVSTVTGEIVHDLRSALDHLAWQCVEYVNPGEATKETAWPILAPGPTPNKKGVRKPPKIAGGVSRTVTALVERTQPYMTVPEAPHLAPLRVLHRMWIRDKHCKIALHGVLAHGSTRGDRPTPSFAWTSELIAVHEHHAELRIIPDDPTVQVEGSVALQIVVQEAPGGKPSPLLETLEDASRIVREIVSEATDTCFV
jgi:hypothetical protein